MKLSIIQYGFLFLSCPKDKKKKTYLTETNEYHTITPLRRLLMKENTKRFPYMLLVFALAALVIVVSVIFGISKKNEDSVGDDNKDHKVVSIYYYNPLSFELEAEERSIKSDTKPAMMEAVLKEWMSNPADVGLQTIMPEDLEITEGFITDDETAELHFSKAYLDLSASEELVLRSSLVWTLTELDFIKNVRFFVDEEEIIDSGEPMGDQNRENTILDKPVMDPTKEEKIMITLYFADKDAMGLIKEEREVELNQQPNLALEKKMIEELLKGPTLENAVSTIPKETTVLEIGLSEGVCDIDFNKEFDTKFYGGSSAEVLMIYSIVNTLTESPNIQKVQILVEGNKVSENTIFQLELSKPLERRDDLILE